jgi:hypothetical protein
VGSYKITVIANDQRGGSDTRTFDISVLNSNDPPVIITHPIITCYEDREYFVSFHGSDPDPTKDVLEWSLQTDCTFLSIDETTGVLSGIPCNDDVGSFSVRINLSDGNGAFDEISFELTVMNINDPPENIRNPGSIILVEDHWSEDVLDLNGLFKDPEGDGLTFIVNPGEPLLVDISEDGSLSAGGIDDWSGGSSIFVTASDGKASTTITIPVTITPENDVPSEIGIILDPLYREGEQGIIRGVADDPDIPYGDELSYQWESDISGDLGTGEEITVELPPGLHIIELTVTDSEGEVISTVASLVVFERISGADPNTDPNGDVELPEPGNHNVDPDHLDQDGSFLEKLMVIILVILAVVMLILAVSIAISIRIRR